MIKRHARMVAVAIAATIGFALVDAPAAMAQASASVPANPPAAKPLSKAQRKAARKAAREKRDADLRAVEKDGYRLTADQNTSTPVRQKAAGKAAADKAAVGASTPAQ